MALPENRELRAVKNYHFADFDCPHCDAHLHVRSLDGFGLVYGTGIGDPGEKWCKCPVCGKALYVHVSFEPYFAAFEDEP